LKLPPFRVWRQLFHDVWTYRAGISSSDWDYLIGRLLRATEESKEAGDYFLEKGSATSSTIREVCLAYSPVLALKATIEDGMTRVYLLLGPDQTDAPVATHSGMEQIARSLSGALNRSVRFTADAARRESLRRLGWVKHSIAGPLENAVLPLEDLRRFALQTPAVAQALVPDENTARKRMEMTGKELAEYRFDARLSILEDVFNRIKVFTQRVGVLSRIAAFSVPTTRLDVAQVIRATLLRFARAQSNINLEMHFTVAEVLADEGLLEIALDAVLANVSREFRSRSTRAPSICAAVEVDGGHVKFSIRDNALPASVPLISQPLEDGTSAYLENGEGSGFGLAMVKDIFVKHGGNCDLIPNTDGFGTRLDGVTFVGVLPWAE